MNQKCCSSFERVITCLLVNIYINGCKVRLEDFSFQFLYRYCRNKMFGSLVKYLFSSNIRIGLHLPQQSCDSFIVVLRFIVLFIADYRDLRQIMNKLILWNEKIHPSPKIVDSILLSLFMRDEGICNTSHIHYQSCNRII